MEQETPGENPLPIAHPLNPCNSGLWQAKEWKEMSSPFPHHHPASAEKWQEGTEEGWECCGLDSSRAPPVSFPTALGLAVFS